MSTEKQKRRIDMKKQKAKAFLDLVKSDSKVLKEDNKKQSHQEMGTQSKQPRKIEVVDVTEEQTNTVKNDESQDVLLERRKVLRERQKAAMQKPKVFLTLDELTRDSPCISEDGVKETPPLVMLDVQHLLMYALLGNRASHRPRWCRLLRVAKVSKVVALVLDAVSVAELRDYPECFPTIRQAFDVEADIIPPEQYGSSLREDLLNVQISLTAIGREIRKSSGIQNVGSEICSIRDQRNQLKTSEGNDSSDISERLGDTNKDNEKLINDNETNERLSGNIQGRDAAEAVGHTYSEKSDIKEDNKISSDSTQESQCGSKSDNKMVMDRRRLMLNTSQILAEGIPMPFGPKVFKDYVFTNEKYEEVTSTSPMFGIDCEMVQTKESTMDLARVSLVNEKLECVYDTFVKPKAPITNYVTKFSGITKAIMNTCNTYIEDAQKRIQEILPADAILCGQSICSDMKSLKMFHPYIIDTSVIYNLTGKRLIKTGLKRLTSYFLSQDIQNDPSGHSSVEDARATIQLVILKLQNGLDFGDLAWDMTSTITNRISQLNENTQDKNTDRDIQNKQERKRQADNTAESSGVTPSKKARMEELRQNREIVTGKQTEGEMTRNKLFFMGGQMEFILNRITHFQKKGIVVEETESSTYYPENSDMVYLETDKLRRKHTLMFIQNNDLVLTGVVIEESESSTFYPENSGMVYLETDKLRRKHTISSVEDNDLVVTTFYKYRDVLQSESTEENQEIVDEQKKKKCLKKLDKHVGKIMSSLPTNSMFVVILGGLVSTDSVSGKVFCKITGQMGNFEPKCLKKLDKHVGKIMSSLPTNSMFVVILGGLVSTDSSSGKKCLKKLDKHVGKIMSRLPNNSMFVVILGGRVSSDSASGKVFSKITGQMGNFEPV